MALKGWGLNLKTMRKMLVPYKVCAETEIALKGSQKWCEISRENIKKSTNRKNATTLYARITTWKQTRIKFIFIYGTVVKSLSFPT